VKPPAPPQGVPELPAEAGEALLDWFRTHARVLPWRTTPRDPWAVWVSEVMLQQTRVATVIPYFERFLTRWPDARALAASELDDLLGAWSGLGYYRRARALHAGAKAVAERSEGSLPTTFEELKKLPGIGDYTAAAIASLAHGERVAVVDGNVRRVIARLLALRGALDSSKDHARIRAIATRTMGQLPPGAFNEAMMELGATVCTPSSPRCETCPVAAWCVASRDGLQRELPETVRRPALKTVRSIAIVLRRANHLLLARHGTDGLFAGMWAPPMLPRPIRADARRALTSLAGGALRWDDAGRAGEVRHVLTHRVLEVEVVACRVDGAEGLPDLSGLPSVATDYSEARWFSLSELDGLALPALARKILHASKMIEVGSEGGVSREG